MPFNLSTPQSCSKLALVTVADALSYHCGALEADGHISLWPDFSHRTTNA